MRVLAVGAGGQGGPCASILARDKDISEIFLGEIDIELISKVKNKIKSDKIRTVKVDAGKIEDIEQAAKGVDAIINLTLPRFDMNIMRAAVKSGAHYVDSARDMDDAIWKQLIEGKSLELDNEFKEAGLTALIACGGSPGVSNVLARYTCDALDRVDSIHASLAIIPKEQLEKPTGKMSAWNPGWCLDEALANFEEEIDVFENGKYKRYPPFSCPDEVNFPEPIGTLLVTAHTHEEAVTLPRFIGKGIRYCAFRYAYDPIADALVQLGLTSGKPIDVRGTKVAPRDFLVKLMAAPANKFLEEDESTAKLPPTLLMVLVMKIKGAKSGRDVIYTLSWPYTLFSTIEEKFELYRQFGTTVIAVALPAVVGAKMCMAGDASRGVIAPECLDATKFLKMMADMGAPVTFQETISSKVTVS